MAFSEQFLNEGEEVVLDLKPHWWVFATPGLILAGALILFVMLRSVTVLDWLTLVGLVGAVGFLGLVYLKWASTQFVVTNRRLVYRSGVLVKNGIEIPLNRVNNVLFRQSLLERALGAGDLTIESAGESGQQKFSNVRKPYAVQNEINHQIEQNMGRRSGGPGVSSPSPAASIPEQIGKLAELRDKGVITQAEFEEKKAELMKRL